MMIILTRVELHESNRKVCGEGMVKDTLVKTVYVLLYRWRQHEQHLKENNSCHNSYHHHKEKQERRNESKEEKEKI